MQKKKKHNNIKQNNKTKPQNNKKHKTKQTKTN